MPIRRETLESSIRYVEPLKELNRRSWPEFLRHGEMPSWNRIYETLPRYVILLIDDNDVLAGAGYTIPAGWSGKIKDLPETIEAIIAGGLTSQGTSPNTLIAVAALVDSRFRGQHLSSEVLTQMKNLARELACKDLLVPVRPTWKPRYPLQSIHSYADWRRADGLYFDPWLRTHQRLGATTLTCVDSTLTVKGTIDDWRTWTGMVFPESGRYVVDGALQPVSINVEDDIGIYDDPNVWMRHRVF